MIALADIRPSVEAGLSSLVPECQREGVELVVACNGPRRAADALRRRYSGIRFSFAELPLAIAELRALGLREATGEFVVLLDDESPATSTVRVAGLLAASLDRAAAPGAERRMVPWRALLTKLWDTTTPVVVPAQATGAAGRQPVTTSHVGGD